MKEEIRLRPGSAEDFPAICDLLADDPAMEVVGAAADVDEAIELARQAQPDVALVDVKMRGGGIP